MDRQSFTEGRISGSGNGLKPGDKVNMAIGRNVEGQPRKLRGRNVHAWVEWQEAGFGIFVVRKVGLYECCVSL